MRSNVRQRNEETFHHRNAGSQRWNRTGIAHSGAGGSRGRAPDQHAELDDVPWIHGMNTAEKAETQQPLSAALFTCSTVVSTSTPRSTLAPASGVAIA